MFHRSLAAVSPVAMTERGFARSRSVLVGATLGSLLLASAGLPAAEADAPGQVEPAGVLPASLPAAQPSLPEGLVPDAVTGRNKIPVRVAVADKPLRAVRVFVSADFGATWQSVGHQRPDENGAVEPVVFEPAAEGYYYLATQAIYQDGSLDPTPQPGNRQGTLLLIDRSAPVLEKFDVLQKGATALLMWRFQDAGSGFVVVEWASEPAQADAAASAVSKLPETDGAGAATAADDLSQLVWRPLTGDEEQAEQAEQSGHLLAGSTRVTLPEPGYVRLVATDGAGLVATSDPRQITFTVKVQEKAPAADDSIPTAPVWPGWLPDAAPVAQQPAQRQVAPPVAQTDVAASGQAATNVPAGGLVASSPAIAVSGQAGAQSVAQPARQHHGALRTAARQPGPVGAAARVDLVLTLLADDDAVGALQAVRHALPAQRSTALACAEAQVHLALADPAAALAILARVPASSVRATEADYWRAEAEYRSGQHSAAKKRLRRLGAESGPWATKARQHELY